MAIVDFHMHFFSRVFFETLAAQSPLPGTPEDRMHAERAIAIAAGLLEQAGRESTPVGLWYPQRAIRQDPQSGRAASGRAVRSLLREQGQLPWRQAAAIAHDV